jgi:AcrR family transcriptional regulator
MDDTPRPYLRADARRRQLLDAATRLFARDGYAGLTMVALAAEAGVSRRLVYDHFPDLPALYDAFFDDRVSRYLDTIDRALAAGGGDVRASFAGAFEALLAVPADDQRVIRMLASDPGLPDLAPVQARFRRHVEARWLGALDDGRIETRRARAVLWTLVSGLFGLADLVARGELPAADALPLATALVADAPHIARAAYAVAAR